MRSLEQYKRDSARLQFTYTCTVDSQLTGFICSLTDSTLSSIATFVLFTARVPPPAKPFYHDRDNGHNTQYHYGYGWLIGKSLDIRVGESCQ